MHIKASCCCKEAVLVKDIISTHLLLLSEETRIKTRTNSKMEVCNFIVTYCLIKQQSHSTYLCADNFASTCLRLASITEK